MKKLLSALCSVAAMLTAAAMELPPGMTIAPDGMLLLGDSKLSITIANTTWGWFDNKVWTDVKTDTGKDSWTIAGKVDVDGTTGNVSASLRRLAPARWRLEAGVDFPAPVACNAICLSCHFPIPSGRIVIDGKEVKIPAGSSSTTLRSAGPAKSVTVELQGGMRYTISGNLQAYVQDNRRWSNTASIRVYFDPSEGNVRKARLSCELEVSPPLIVPVDLGNAANRTFADPDGSGWTGQGAGNDLSGLKPGRIEIGGFPFQVREGKGAIVVGRKAPASVKLALPAGEAKSINLLHASAWTPERGTVLGYLDVVYADGKKESIPVKSRIDCGNWWLGSSLPNAAVAVRLENNSCSVGLYASSFPLSGKKPVSVTFRSAAPDACWMIAAVTLSDRPIRFPMTQDRPLIIKAGGMWQPYTFDRKIVPGSPLDFSGMLDAPAGKYGFVRSAPDGSFTFENAPDKRIRFFGTNLCMSANFLDKKTVDAMVDYMARLGYNAVRFHHHDNWMLDKKAPDSLTFDPAQMDKLDYLFAKCKERGIYLTSDLYVSRVLRAGDNLGCESYGSSQVMKALLGINRAALENWKEFARKWMAHKNPYTGLTWGEDPALIFLNLTNEENLNSTWDKTPETAEIYRKKFQEWKTANNASESDFPRFLQEIQTGVLDEQIDFVKNELKLKTMITSLNMQAYAPLTLMRDKFDLVDNHQYFCHPTFPEKKWSLPQGSDQGSAIMRNAILPRLIMPTRIFGRPFTVTEFNFCNPNVYRAEGGPLIGGYAALQNWGGLWRFAWSHSEDGILKQRIGGSFDGVNDPMQQFGDRIIHALFLRGDLAPATEKISVAVPRDPFGENGSGDYSEEFSRLGLHAQIGSHVEGKPLPAGVKQFKSGMAVKNESRVKLDRNAGSLTIASPLTETVTLREGTLGADKLRVRDASTFMTVAAISLDRKPLPQSRSILLIHLTNFTTTNIHFGNEGKTLLRSWGKLPILVERGTAGIELAVDGPCRIAALASDGSEAGEVKGEFKDGVLRFTADTCKFPGGVSAYHLTR